MQYVIQTNAGFLLMSDYRAPLWGARERAAKFRDFQLAMRFAREVANRGWFRVLKETTTR